MSLFWLGVAVCVVTPFAIEIFSKSSADAATMVDVEGYRDKALAIEKKAARDARLAPHRDSLKSLEQRCRRINELLSRRFGKTEITAARYRLGIEEVRLGFLGNIERQCELLDAIAHLDREQIRAELESLTDARDIDRVPILQGRMRLLDDVDERLLALRIANERALTALDTSLVSLSSLPAKGARIEDLDAAIVELESLVSRAHRLGTQSGARADTTARVITPGAMDE